MAKVEQYTGDEKLRTENKETLIENGQALEGLLALLDMPGGEDLARKALSKPRRNKD